LIIKKRNYFIKGGKISMSSKILLKFLGGCLALFIVMGIATKNTEAQVVASGQTETTASQIIVPVLQDGHGCLGENPGGISRNTTVQVTNTSTDAVTLHIQFLDADDCTEANFFDTFTGEDTHVYDLGDCWVNDFGGLCPMETDKDGIFILTPVVSGQDNADAIAFNHIAGVVNTTTDAPENCWGDGSGEVDFAYRYNAVGRNAVNLATGALLADGTVLDGASSGLEIILPTELMYHYNSEFAEGAGAVYADLIIVAINDDYSIPSQYSAVGGTTATFRLSDIVDDDELRISCGDRRFECLEVVGINNAITTLDDAHDPFPDIICDETSHTTGYDRLVARPDAAAHATFAILGLATSDFGGASHTFVE
jgi:hypothetical protein